MADPSPSSGSRRRVGVLALHNSTETRSILNAVESLGHDAVWLREETLETRIAEGRVILEPDVDVVINRLLLTKAARPIEDLGIAAIYEHVRPVLNSPTAVLRATHKMAAGTALARADIPIPDAAMALSAARTEAARTHLTDPVVNKPAVGTNGSLVTRRSAEDPVAPMLARRRAFLQEFLNRPSETGRHADVRVYVVGSRIVGAMRRTAPADEWRTNVALGGDVRDITDRLPPDAARAARRATDALGLDMAGVDLLEDEEEWAVLEVNATAGFKGLYEATNRSPAPAIAALAIERVDGAVDRPAVSRLATRLDGDRPMPSGSGVATAGTDGGHPTVSLTESVAIAGTNGVTRTVGKADTGAARTSIDADLAAAIEAGPVTGTAEIRSSHGSETRPLVDVDLRVAGDWHAVTVGIDDRSSMRYPVLLGRDVLTGVRVAIDQPADTDHPVPNGSGREE